MRQTKAQLAMLAAEREALDAGREYWNDHREMTLTEVHREASKRYEIWKDHAFAFVQGFAERRRAHDEYLREAQP